ncbi:hypothetical protein BC827DRAFT_1184598 [Russula dissimulans]|nr:hypothetical protein BC827DRAFT_1184598 [Russula dissimulans]
MGWVSHPSVLTPSACPATAIRHGCVQLHAQLGYLPPLLSIPHPFLHSPSPSSLTLSQAVLSALSKDGLRLAMSEHWQVLDTQSKPSSHSESHVHAKLTRLSPEGRAVLIQSFDDGCHFPSREEKELLLRQVQKTVPGYSLAKLSSWFTNRRRHFPEYKREPKDGSDDVLNSLLNPTTRLAREMWPSLSEDTLHRLHDMLLEQPHPTTPHKDILASHFRVERQHVENFINWRVACLHPDGSHPHREDFHRGRKHLPPIVTDDDAMEEDELSEPRAHLPTPAGSISPEPLHSEPSFVRALVNRRPSINTGSFPSLQGEPESPHSPVTTTESHSRTRPPPLHTLSHLAPIQANSPVRTHLPSPPPHHPVSPAKPTHVSPPSPSARPSVPSPSRDVSFPTMTSRTQKDRRNRAAPKKSPRSPASAPRVPHTLREFEEAYAPTYARFEWFLQNVERGNCVHVGLTPEMLKSIKPQRP